MIPAMDGSEGSWTGCPPTPPPPLGPCTDVGFRLHPNPLYGKWSGGGMGRPHEFLSDRSHVCMFTKKVGGVANNFFLTLNIDPIFLNPQIPSTGGSRMPTTLSDWVSAGPLSGFVFKEWRKNDLIRRPFGNAQPYLTATVTS